MEAMVRLVTAEVMRQLNLQDKSGPETTREENIAKNRKKILVIFTGGTSGLAEGLAAVKRLQGLPAAVSIALSPEAQRIIGEDRIKEYLGREVALYTARDQFPWEVLQEADLVMVPVLTRNTAAKIACTITDSLASTLIMQGLMLGKPVLAAEDSAHPRNVWPGNCPMGSKCAPLMQALQENLKRVRQFGVQLVQAAALGEEALQLLQCVKKQRSGETPGKKSLISVETIRQAAGSGKIVHVPPGAIVTPLSRDVAQELGVRIIHTDL